MSKDKELLRQKTEEMQKKLKGNNYNRRDDDEAPRKKSFLISQYDTLDTSSGISEIKTSNLVPAPIEWNFYKPLNDTKTTELIDSILANGLLQPIVVWEQEDGTYMVLAGHNRVRVFDILYGATKNEEYLKIPALIKQRHEITEEQAREIIIDTNWVSRELSPIEKSKSISTKYGILQSGKSKYGKYGDGRVRDKIAEDYTISGRQIEVYRSLEKLIPPLKDLLDKAEINFSPAAKLAVFNEDLQSFIFENYPEKIISKYTKLLRSNMELQDIKEIFEDSVEINKKVNLNIKVPVSLQDKFTTLTTEKKKELESIILNWLTKNV